LQRAVEALNEMSPEQLKQLFREVLIDTLWKLVP